MAIAINIDLKFWLKTKKSISCCVSFREKLQLCNGKEDNKIFIFVKSIKHYLNREMDNNFIHLDLLYG